MRYKVISAIFSCICWRSDLDYISPVFDIPPGLL